MTEIFIYLCTFLAVFLGLLFLINLFSKEDYSKRLKGLQNKNESAQLNPVLEKESTFNVVKLVEPLSKISIPKEGWENSPLRVQFSQAGWRNENATTLYFGIKTLLTFALPVLLFVLFNQTFSSEHIFPAISLLICGASVGIVSPKIYLDIVTSKRKQEIINAFPDALDLLVICMDAGLSFDQALMRVSREIKIKSQILSDELDLILIEIRSGKSRELALRHFVLRVGIEDIESFATMIIQAERYGTSLSESLKISSNDLRTKRRQRAEEKAAKIPVKLLIPVGLFMLPTLIMILTGPALLEVLRSLNTVQ